MSATAVPGSLGDRGSVAGVRQGPNAAEEALPDQWLRRSGGTSAGSYGENECLSLRGLTAGILKGESM